jgi:formylmethanofuran dehydrogenase subunit E
MKIRQSYPREPLKRCVDFHGHLCPGLAIGFQASRVLLKRLGVRKASDEERVAIVENDACGADAVQVMTGCTFGKGNFVFKKYGKHAFSLLDRKQRRGFRVCFREEAVLGRPEPLSVSSGKQPGTVESKEQRVRKILEAVPESLFKIEEITFEMPPMARVVPSQKCDACGELTKIDLLRKSGDKRICTPCSRGLRSAFLRKKRIRSQEK